MSRP
ncbi:hypothetical protein ECPA14_2334, partial [Escherichia coli PA14]|jgi:hypothetical protein